MRQLHGDHVVGKFDAALNRIERLVALGREHATALADLLGKLGGRVLCDCAESRVRRILYLKGLRPLVEA